jgi:hypothetical protein
LATSVCQSIPTRIQSEVSFISPLNWTRVGLKQG